MVDRVSPRGLKAIFEVLDGTAGPLELGVLKAMLVTAGSTIVADLDTSALLSDVTTLEEFVIATAVQRITLTGVTITIVNTDDVKLDFANPSWPSLAAGDVNTPTWMVVYIQKAGAAADPSLLARVPILVTDAVGTPDGSNFNYIVPATGMVLIDTAV